MKATVRELRRMFFDNDYDAVLFADEMTNKEVRDELYNMVNQDKVMNYKIENNFVFIWEVETKFNN